MELPYHHCISHSTISLNSAKSVTTRCRLDDWRKIFLGKTSTGADRVVACKSTFTMQKLACDRIQIRIHDSHVESRV